MVLEADFLVQGIDLGNDRSVTSILSGINAQPVLVRNNLSNDSTPTAVAFAKSNRRTLGDAGAIWTGAMKYAQDHARIFAEKLSLCKLIREDLLLATNIRTLATGFRAYSLALRFLLCLSCNL